MKDERTRPIDRDDDLYGERCKPSIDCDNAQRREVDARLYDSCTQEPRCQWVGYSGSASDERYNDQASEEWQALKAIRMGPRQTLHERRKVGVLGIELIRTNPALQDEMAAQHLHDDEQ